MNDTAERRLIVTVMLLAIALDAMCAPATAPAIDAIAGAFHLGFRTGAWLTLSFDAGYLTAIVVSIWCIARFGKRSYLGWSLASFAVFSGVCALSGSANVLIVARALQGASAGAFFTAGLLTIVATAPKADLPLAMVLFSAVSLLAPTLSPMYAGAILEHGTWRVAFAGLAAPAALGAVLCFVWMKDVAEPRVQGFDVASFAAIVIGLTSFQFLTIEGSALHWFATPAAVIAAFVLVAAVAVYASRELKVSPAPFLDLRVLALPIPARGLIAGILLGALLQGAGVDAQFARTAFHLGPLEVGAFVAIRCIGFAFGLVAVTMFARVPARVAVSGGLVVVAGTCLWQSEAIRNACGIETHAAIGIVASAAYAFVLGPLATTLFGSIRREQMPSLVVLFKLSALVGGSLGLAAVATAFERAAAARVPQESVFAAYWLVCAAIAVAAAVVGFSLRPSDTPASRPVAVSGGAS